jgi:putative transposase
MAKDPKIYEGGVYYVTMTVVGWIDVFTRREYRDIITTNLRYCVEKKNLEIFAYCLMTNHLHMIVRGGENGDLAKLLRGFKSVTGKAILDSVATNPRESRREWLVDRFAFFARTLAQDTQRQFWHRETYPEEVRTDEFFEQKRHYIEENPVRAGFVDRPEDWHHSSANPECPVPITRF